MVDREKSIIFIPTSGAAPVLNYARRLPSNAIPFIVPLRFWRSIAALCLPFLVLLLTFDPALVIVALIALTGFMLASTMTLVYMTRLAASEVGVGYAARYLVLAIILMPVFLGVFLVPQLVEWDIIKRRQRR